jgi:hypothetical protein
MITRHGRFAEGGHRGTGESGPTKQTPTGQTPTRQPSTGQTPERQTPFRWTTPGRPWPIRSWKPADGQSGSRSPPSNELWPRPCRNCSQLRTTAGVASVVGPGDGWRNFARLFLQPASKSSVENLLRWTGSLSQTGNRGGGQAQRDARILACCRDLSPVGLVGLMPRPRGPMATGARFAGREECGAGLPNWRKRRRRRRR